MITIFALLASPALVSALVALVSAQIWPAPAADQSAACKATSSFAALKKLPPGLVLADIDTGPHLIAHTKHSALASPYHRANEGIATAHRLWSSPLPRAREMLRARDIDYVLLCTSRGKLPIRFDGAGLRTSLERGASPDFLAPVPGGDAFGLWRVE